MEKSRLDCTLQVIPHGNKACRRFGLTMERIHRTISRIVYLWKINSCLRWGYSLRSEYSVGMAGYFICLVEHLEQRRHLDSMTRGVLNFPRPTILPTADDKGSFRKARNISPTTHSLTNAPRFWKLVAADAPELHVHMLIYEYDQIFSNTWVECPGPVPHIH